MLHVRVVTGSGGGPEKTILNSPRYLFDLGYGALCAYLHPPGDPGFAQLQAKAEALAAPLVSIEDRGPWDWRVAARLARLCRERRVAIWHGHDYKSNAMGLLVRRIWPMKLVTTVHGWVKFTRRTPLYYAIDRWCLRRYDRVICVSQDLADQCAKLGVATERRRLIPNAIDTDEFARRVPTMEAKTRLGLDSGRLLVGAVGRLSAEKGFDVLIRAVDGLIAAGHDIELDILGEGDARPELAALIEQLDRGDRIRLVGQQDDPSIWYQAMDVFALSSLREGLPNVVLEAMALETPLVATRVAGVPDVIEHEKNGLLVEPSVVADLQHGLVRLLGDAPLRRSLARAARETVERHYSFRERMRQEAAVYDELVAS